MTPPRARPRLRDLNPWVVVPVVLGLLAGGFLGYAVTIVSCSGGCVAAAVITAIVAGALSAFGMGVVGVLAARSLEEWRAAEAAGVPPPGPGCETPDRGPSTD